MEYYVTNSTVTTILKNMETIKGADVAMVCRSNFCNFFPKWVGFHIGLH